MKRKKEVNKADAKIPSGERERRIQELKGQEVKKFLEEREMVRNVVVVELACAAAAGGGNKMFCLLQFCCCVEAAYV